MKKVLVGGCFDVLHFGHVYFLEKTKHRGDYLIVALESDKNVARLKGKNRPVHTQKQRKLMLTALKAVDKVIALPEMKTDSDYAKLVKKVSPDIIAVTAGDPNLEKKRSHAKVVGARVIQIKKLEVPSTTKILNNYVSGSIKR